MKLKRPNILWLCTDQQRWDTIHTLGNDHINTPNLDKLVKDGVAFTQTFSQSTICTPSRASFMTGRYPIAHHVHRNGAQYFPKNEVLISRMFADAGYTCGLIGKLHLSRAHNILEKRPDDGYQIFYYSQHPYPDGPEPYDYAYWLKEEKCVDIRELYKNIKCHYGVGVPEEYQHTTWARVRACKFIEDNKDKPWFLSVNLFDPHPPFYPPQRYLNNYNSKEMPLPLFQESDLENQKNFIKIDQQAKNSVDIFAMDKSKLYEGKNEDPVHSTPPENYNPREVKAYYYATIEFIDHQFGKIIDLLEKTGQFADTLIIFTSDHGELLGDHGLLYKGCRFYEGLVHVPLIMSYKNKFKKGLRSKALVELVDIAPTLLETVGLEIPYYIQGKSLYHLLIGQTDPNFHKKYVICEYNDALNLPDATHGSMYFDGRFKSILYHNHNIGELYDLENDTGEFNNLWYKPEYQNLKNELILKHFNAMMASTSAGIKRVGNY